MLSLWAHDLSYTPLTQLNTSRFQKEMNLVGYSHGNNIILSCLFPQNLPHGSISAEPGSVSRSLVGFPTHS